MAHLVDGGGKVWRRIGERAVQVEQHGLAKTKCVFVVFALGQGRRIAHRLDWVGVLADQASRRQASM
jgi:hypothetical protein